MHFSRHLLALVLSIPASGAEVYAQAQRRAVQGGHPAVMSRPNDWGRTDRYAPYTKQLPLPLQARVAGGSPQIRWLGQYVCVLLSHGLEMRVTNFWDRQSYGFYENGRAVYGFETFQPRRDQPYELMVTDVLLNGRYIRGKEREAFFGLLELNDHGRPEPHTCP